MQQTRSDLATCRSQLHQTTEHETQAVTALETAGRVAEEQDQRMEAIKNRCQDIMAEMMSKLREERASRVEVEANLAKVANEKKKMQILFDASKVHRYILEPRIANDVPTNEDPVRAHWEVQDLAVELDITTKRVKVTEAEAEKASEKGAVVYTKQNAEAEAAAPVEGAPSTEIVEVLNTQPQERVAYIESSLAHSSGTDSFRKEIDRKEDEGGESGGAGLAERTSLCSITDPRDKEIQSLRAQLRNLNEGFARREQALRNEVVMQQSQVAQLVELHREIGEQLTHTKHYCKDAVQSVAEHLCSVLAELDASHPVRMRVQEGRRTAQAQEQSSLSAIMEGEICSRACASESAI